MLSLSTVAPSTSLPISLHGSEHTRLHLYTGWGMHWGMEWWIDWLFAVLQMELGALRMTGKHSSTRLNACVFQRALFLALWDLDGHLDSQIWICYLPPCSRDSCCPKALYSRPKGSLLFFFFALIWGIIGSCTVAMSPKIKPTFLDSVGSGDP